MRKLKGALSIASNSYGMPTGYGQQTKLLIDRLLRSGMTVANLSNFGLEGSIEKKKTPYGSFTMYPKGFRPYSDDVIPLWHAHHVAKNPDIPNALLTLYDVWVYNEMKFEGDILSWVPLDHSTLPPNVLKFLQKDNVYPITMSPHGKRQLDAIGMENTYIPHAVDTSVYKPTKTLQGEPTRRILDVPDDAFLVSIVAANKADGRVHRKAIAEGILSFALFRKKNPDAYLYLHMEPSNAFGGFRIPPLLKSVGLDEDCVRISNPHELRIGYAEKDVAALYTASDVLLSPSMGEGFGVCLIEAAACGLRTITSSWTAPQDLASPDSWLVQGQPHYDEPQQAWMEVPLVDSIVNALQLAYDAPRGTSEESIEFAKQFDADRVFAEYWLPFLEQRFPA